MSKNRRTIRRASLVLLPLVLAGAAVSTVSAASAAPSHNEAVISRWI